MDLSWKIPQYLSVFNLGHSQNTTLFLFKIQKTAALHQTERQAFLSLPLSLSSPLPPSLPPTPPPPRLTLKMWDDFHIPFCLLLFFSCQFSPLPAEVSGCVVLITVQTYTQALRAGAGTSLLPQRVQNPDPRVTVPSLCWREGQGYLVSAGQADMDRQNVICLSFGAITFMPRINHLNTCQSSCPKELWGPNQFFRTLFLQIFYWVKKKLGK